MNTRSKKAQFGIVTLIGVALTLLLLAPIMLKVVRTSVGGFADAINSTSPEAAAAVNAIESKFVTFWDYLIMIAFGISILLLFVSAFFIDTHPVFVLLYIFVAFLCMAFAPAMMDVVDKVWDQAAFSEETGMYLTFTSFLHNHFEGILLGMILLSGIIIYAKIKMFSNNYA